MGTCGILELNSCCHFISLRTGTKICGFVALVGSLMLVIMSSYKIMLIIPSIDDGEDLQSIILDLEIDIGLQLSHAVTSCCLLVGVYQERGRLMTPWLVTAVLTALAEVVFLPGLFHRMVIWEVTDHPLGYVELVLLTILLLVDDVYGWLVVFSYYRSLNTGESSV